MLYSEFLQATDAPDNMISHIIYSGLNRIYMRHDEYTKDEAYRDGFKILDDLAQVATVKRVVDKMCYYHGIDKPFTYSCGYCGADVKDEDAYCRLCGAEFDQKPKLPVTQDKDLKCRSGSLYGETCHDVNNLLKQDKRKEE